MSLEVIDGTPTAISGYLRKREEREKEGILMKRIRNQLRIHWKWLKDKEDYNEVADFIYAWMKQTQSKHKCITSDKQRSAK